MSGLAGFQVDILDEDTNNVTQEVLVERLNMNVPSEARAALRRFASRARLKEAEMARALLLRAIEQEEREEFAQALDAARSPDLTARLRKIQRSMEKLRRAPR